VKTFSGWARGQIGVILTLAITILLGAAALGADVAVFYFNWVQLQKAADASAIAGATFLPSNPDLAISTADQYAQSNGIQASEIVSTQVSSDDMSVQIKLARTVPYYFANLLGLTTGKVGAAATAGLKASKSARGLVPIGLQSGTPLTTYQSVTLKLAPAQGFVGPGNWEPMAMGYTASSDTGGANYRSNIEYGYQGIVTIGDSIYTETGNLVGPTQQGINYRLSGGSTSDATGTAVDHTLNDPRVIEIPVVDFNDPNGKSQVPLVGFAELWITSVQGNGNITCEFITQVAADNFPDDNSSSSTTPGPFAVVLIQ
jgi:hypothetical protein